MPKIWQGGDGSENVIYKAAQLVKCGRFSRGNEFLGSSDIKVKIEKKKFVFGCLCPLYNVVTANKFTKTCMWCTCRVMVLFIEPILTTTSFICMTIQAHTVLQKLFFRNQNYIIGHIKKTCQWGPVRIEKNFHESTLASVHIKNSWPL